MPGEDERYTVEQQKDIQIFEEELLPHATAIYNFAYRLVLDEDEAKDLVQETSGSTSQPEDHSSGIE